MNQQLFSEITAFFNKLPRQGVGSTQSFQKAFNLLPKLGAGSQIVDIGCGTGGQTLDLLTHCAGHVTAVDSSQSSLDILKEKADKAGFSDRIEILCEDITEMELFEQSFDLIWSEGAIYNFGLEEGLTTWRSLLKQSAYVVVNDCCWLTDTPDPETLGFWNEGYPGMTNQLTAQQCIERAGFKLIESFVQPENDWWENFYTPMEQEIALQKNRSAEELPEGYMAFLAGMEAEIGLRRKHKREYGYVFFILEKK